MAAKASRCLLDGTLDLVIVVIQVVYLFIVFVGKWLLYPLFLGGDWMLSFLGC